MDTKACTACLSSINARASRCPHCRTWQSDASPMHRGHGDKMISGVCASIAYQVGLDVTLIRVAFAIAAAVSFGLAVGAYFLLWVVTPPTPEGRAPLARLIDWLNSLVGKVQRSDLPR